MALQLKNVFPGKRVRVREKQPDAFIYQLAVLIQKRPVMGVSGLWRIPQHCGGNVLCQWPRYSNNSYASLARCCGYGCYGVGRRSEEHTSELQSRPHLVCRLLLEKKK